MKILVLEYITGGGLRQEPLPAGLAAEAELMVHALLHDLIDADESIKLVLLRDNRLPSLTIAGDVQVVDIDDNDDFRACWQSYATQCDAVWPIAPETDGILAAVCRSVESSGRYLLNSSSSAVSIASSKLETIKLLERHGIPIVETTWLREAVLTAGRSVVVKPDDGVGCEGMCFFSEKLPDPGLFPSNFIVQQWLSGESLSLSGIFHRGDARLLSVNRQVVDIGQQSSVLRACEVNVYHDGEGEWQYLLEQIAQAMPGLWGYVGIDLIMAHSGPVILEINPRLTSSYAGIRDATGINPAKEVLKLVHADKIGDFICQNIKICRVEPDKAYDTQL